MIANELTEMFCFSNDLQLSCHPFLDHAILYIYSVGQKNWPVRFSPTTYMYFHIEEVISRPTGPKF